MSPVPTGLKCGRDSFCPNQNDNTSSSETLVFASCAGFECDRMSLPLISLFILLFVVILLISVSLKYVLPVTKSLFLCIYVTVRQALIFGGLWEARSFLLNSFIRSPAVSCQGFSLLLVSEGRTGRVEPVGIRSQLL